MGLRTRVCRLAAAASTIALIATAPAQAATSHQQVTQVGTFSFSGLGGSPGTLGAQIPPHQPMNKTLRHTAASQAPNVTGTPVAGGTGGALGFNGLDAFQQASAGTGSYAGTQFDVSPPDQGLCVGHGDVVEGVNLAMRVYSTTTDQPLTSAVPFNQFFKLAPEAATNQDGSITYGPFLSDPKCYYDPGTARWFLSILEFSVNPQTGAFGNSALQLLAVSESSDPTGSWRLYSFPTTDDGTAGTPNDPGCPCFGDQPLLGADANGIYITTNEYSITGPAYNGAQLYALSKAALEKGGPTTVVHMQPGSDPSITSALGGVAFSIQPATSPAEGYDASAGGTEYFQSALDFGAAPALGTSANRIAVWNLTDSSSLGGTDPDPSLHVAVLPSELYSQPPNATQAPGTLTLNTRLPLLDANDDRMNQVVYAGGHLWSGVNSAVQTQQGSTRPGIAWFATSPHTTSGGQLTANLAGQGYLAVNQEAVLFPSIGVTPNGKAVMAFTLTGPDYHPSAAWAPLSLLSGAGPVHVAAAGQNPDDDFTALKAFGGTGSSRWGDYSAAVSDPAGNVWMGVEYISGVERTQFADWSTYLFHVTP